MVLFNGFFARLQPLKNFLQKHAKSNNMLKVLHIARNQCNPESLVKENIVLFVEIIHLIHLSSHPIAKINLTKHACHWN